MKTLKLLNSRMDNSTAIHDFDVDNERKMTGVLYKVIYDYVVKNMRQGDIYLENDTVTQTFNEFMSAHERMEKKFNC